MSMEISITSRNLRSQNTFIPIKYIRRNHTVLHFPPNTGERPVGLELLFVHWTLMQLRKSAQSEGPLDKSITSNHQQEHELIRKPTHEHGPETYGSVWATTSATKSIAWIVRELVFRIPFLDSSKPAKHTRPI